MKLSGKGVLVTGASSGIGRAIALYLAKDGADVAVNHRSNLKGANEVVKEIEGGGRKGLAVREFSTVDEK